MWGIHINYYSPIRALATTLVIFLSWPVAGTADNSTGAFALQDLQTIETLSAHEYRRALSQYSQLLRENPYDFEARVGLARAYLELGDVRRADREADWLLARNPNYFGGLFIKGDVLWHQHRYIDAATYFWLAELIEPDSALLQLRLHQTLKALGDSSGADRALRYYETLVKEQSRQTTDRADDTSDGHLADKPDPESSDDST